MEKRIMTWKLAATLMDALCCVAISAEGGLSKDLDLDWCQNYARKQFMDICQAWEDAKGFEWEIEDPKGDEPCQTLMA